MRFRCNLPACGAFPKGFEFEDNGGECPKCGAKGPPLVATLTDICLLVPDRKGPIRGRSGGLYVACQPARAYLCRHSEDRFAATGDVLAVTCPRCVKTREFRERAAGIDELAGLLETAPRVTVDFAPQSAGG